MLNKISLELKSFSIVYIIFSLPISISSIVFYLRKVNKIKNDMNKILISWRFIELIYAAIFYAFSQLSITLIVSTSNFIHICILWYSSANLFNLIVNSYLCKKAINIKVLFYDIISLLIGILLVYIYDYQLQTNIETIEYDQPKVNLIIGTLFSRAFFSLSKNFHLKYLIKSGIYSKKHGVLSENKNEYKNVLNAESIISKYVEDVFQFMPQEEKEKAATYSDLVSHVKSNLEAEKFNHFCEVQSFLLNAQLKPNQVEEAAKSNTFLRYNIRYRQQLLDAYPAAYAKEFFANTDRINFAKYVDYQTQVAINECEVGKYHKWQYFKFKVDRNKVKFRNNILTTEDVLKTMFNDMNCALTQSHYFCNNTEINLTKLDKIVDYPHMESSHISVDTESAVCLNFFNLVAMLAHVFTMCYIQPSNYYFDAYELCYIWSPVFYILIAYSIFLVFKYWIEYQFVLGMNFKYLERIQENAIMIKLTVLIIAQKLVLESSLLIGLLSIILVAHLTFQEKMSFLHTHYLESLLSMLKLAQPFTNKDTEWVRLRIWVDELKQKCSLHDVYNQLFDYILCNYGDHLFLNQSYYLKYRSNTNIYHKRILRNWDQMYPRPVSHYVFKNYNLSNKGNFYNLIQGKGVPLPYNWWVKAKNTIYKTFKNREKVTRATALTTQTEEQEKEAKRKEDEVLEKNADEIKYYFDLTETTSLITLDLKKKIQMTLPVTNEEFYEKDSNIESENDEEPIEKKRFSADEIDIKNSENYDQVKRASANPQAIKQHSKQKQETKLLQSNEKQLVSLPDDSEVSSNVESKEANFISNQVPIIAPTENKKPSYSKAAEDQYDEYGSTMQQDDLMLDQMANTQTNFSNYSASLDFTRNKNVIDLIAKENEDIDGKISEQKSTNDIKDLKSGLNRTSERYNEPLIKDSKKDYADSNPRYIEDINMEFVSEPQDQEINYENYGDKLDEVDQSLENIANRKKFKFDNMF